MTSPASSDSLSLRTLTVPSAATNSSRTWVAVSTVVDFSLSKKSLPAMWATRAFEPLAGHCCIILWGCF